jgi:hypothetical protein
MRPSKQKPAKKTVKPVEMPEEKRRVHAAEPQPKI